MSRQRHAVQRLRKLHRSFGAGPRQGLSCDHDRWTNASLRAGFTLRVKCFVSTRQKLTSPLWPQKKAASTTSANPDRTME